MSDMEDVIPTWRTVVIAKFSDVFNAPAAWAELDPDATLLAMFVGLAALRGGGAAADAHRLMDAVYADAVRDKHIRSHRK